MEVIGSVPATSSDKSSVRVDTALLASALFLQRFALPFGETFLNMDLVAGAFILFHQFFSGKLLIEYDRLLLFLAVVVAFASSLVLNSSSATPTAFFQFLLLCSLLTLTRPSTPDQYKSTLHAFQMLVMVLSCLGVAQFVAQFVLDGAKLNMFYGIFPDFILPSGRAHTTHLTEGGSSFLKANAIFLAEPANLSQVTAFGMLIEVLEFRRPRYLIIITVGFLLAYSGTGLMILVLFLPLASLHHGRVALTVLLVAIFAVGLFATGILDSSVFLSRTSEFTTTGTSGFDRFVSPFWLTAKFFSTGSLQAFLLGNGPGSGTHEVFRIDAWTGGALGGWSRPLYEYGIIGSFILVCFWASCLRRSGCPGILLAALIFFDLVVATPFVSWVSIMTIVLCTLQNQQPRRGGRDETDHQYRSSVAGPEQADYAARCLPTYWARYRAELVSGVFKWARSFGIREALARVPAPII